MPSYTLADLSIQKEMQVQVFDPNDNFLGIWRDAPLITGIKETMNAAGSTIHIALPRQIDAYGGSNQPGSDNTVTLGNIVKIFIFGAGLPATGIIKFQGVIDAIAPDLASTGGESIVVTITPLSSAIADHGLAGSLTFTNVDPIAIFNHFFTTTDSITGTWYTAPLTLDPFNATSSGLSVTYTVNNTDLKSIFDTVMQMLGPQYFWRPNASSSLVTLQQLPIIPQHTVMLGQHINTLSYSVDNTQRKNVIYFQGNGVSATAVGASAAPPSSGGIGERILFKQDSRVTDAPTCNVMAASLLAYYDRPLIRTKATLVDYRGDTYGGLGIDIEAFKVGDTVTFLDATGKVVVSLWDLMKWDNAAWDFSAGAAFNTVAPIVSLQYDFYTITIEVGTLQPSQSRALSNLQRAFQDYTLGT